MVNYNDFEYEFVSRTIKLIEQYNEFVQTEPFDEQFNYTLMLNCLLGLIVMPKELVISHVPTTRLTREFKTELGLVESDLPGPETTLRDLIQKMRHSIAHFDIDVISNDNQNLVDFILFKDDVHGEVYARFKSDEVLPFLRFYTDILLSNLQNFRTRSL